MENELKLLPCPFCGSTDIRHESPWITDEEWHMIKCYGDGCEVRTDWWLHKEEAIASWNRRASGWISVTDRMPEPMIEVWVILDNGHYEVDKWVDSKHNEGDPGWIWFDNVTHWMPIHKLEDKP